MRRCVGLDLTRAPALIRNHYSSCAGYDQNDEIRMTSVEMMSSDPDFFRHPSFVIVNCLDFSRCDD